MFLSANSQQRDLQNRRLLPAVSGALLAVAFIHIWIIPLIWPRGNYLWGHYRLKDIYLGIPVALATISILLVIICPGRYRNSLSLRLVPLVISLLGVFALLDAAYAFGVMRAWEANFWLDQAHISRRYSVADNELGFVRKPHVRWRGNISDANRIVDYRSDGNGFRNAPGIQRADIVFIGDSYTEAGTAAEEDTFVQRVARSTGLSVVNLGRGAYGPQQELIVLKRYGLSYQPRFVVWQLFEGNDLLDAEVFARWRRNAQQVNTSLLDRYFENSLLNQWLPKTRSQELSGPPVTLRYHDGTLSRIRLRYAYEPDQPLTALLGIAETMAAIESGQQLCQSQGIHLLVVMVPTFVRVMAPDLTFDRAEDQIKYLPKERAETANDFSGTINDLCDRKDCDFIDGFAAFRQAASTGSRHLYIPNDEHLDLGGHEVMARLVADWLRSKNVSDSDQPNSESVP